MKKMMALVLAVLMATALSVTGWAEGEEELPAFQFFNAETEEVPESGNILKFTPTINCLDQANTPQGRWNYSSAQKVKSVVASDPGYLKLILTGPDGWSGDYNTQEGERYLGQIGFAFHKGGKDFEAGDEGRIFTGTNLTITFENGSDITYHIEWAVTDQPRVNPLGFFTADGTQPASWKRLVRDQEYTFRYVLTNKNNKAVDFEAIESSVFITYADILQVGEVSRDAEKKEFIVKLKIDGSIISLGFLVGDFWGGGATTVALRHPFQVGMLGDGGNDPTDNLVNSVMSWLKIKAGQDAKLLLDNGDALSIETMEVLSKSSATLTLVVGDATFGIKGGFDMKAEPGRIYYPFSNQKLNIGDANDLFELVGELPTGTGLSGQLGGQFPDEFMKKDYEEYLAKYAADNRVLNLGPTPLLSYEQWLKEKGKNVGQMEAKKLGGEMTFPTPVAITCRTGFAPGSRIELYHYNEETGGIKRVSDSGEITVDRDGNLSFTTPSLGGFLLKVRGN